MLETSQFPHLDEDGQIPTARISAVRLGIGDLFAQLRDWLGERFGLSAELGDFTLREFLEGYEANTRGASSRFVPDRGPVFAYRRVGLQICAESSFDSSASSTMTG